MNIERIAAFFGVPDEIVKKYPAIAWRALEEQYEIADKMLEEKNAEYWLKDKRRLL